MLTKQRPLKVFLCHAHSDKNIVRDLYLRLIKDGVDAWLDKEKLLPGQDWELEIRKAVRESDVVVVCLSKQFNQAGFRQKEVRLALDTAMEQPDGEIFIIPARLDECESLESLRKWQWVNLFEEDGYESLLRALRARADKIGATVDIKGDLLSKVLTPSKGNEHMLGKAKSPAPEGRVAGAAIEKPISVGGSVSESVVVAGSVNVMNVGRAPVTPRQENEGDAVEKSSRENAKRSATEKAKHEQERTRKPKKKNKIDPSIIAALIGVFGTILVTLITLYANRQTALQTPTPTTLVAFTSTATDPPIPTVTITLVEPTFTPMPATDTPIPTPTGVPPVELGKDWAAGCISTSWKPYPSEVPVTEKGDGCWKEPVHVFSAENGDLDFLAERKNGSPEIYGLFAPLPEKGTVTIRIRLRDLSNVDLWMGVFAEPDVNSKGLLMIIPSGNVKKRVFAQKEISDYETINTTSVLNQGSGFSVSFTFTTNSARSTVNPSIFVTSSVSIPSAQKWLFLGYKGLSGRYRVDGTFLSFELK